MPVGVVALASGLLVMVLLVEDVPTLHFAASKLSWRNPHPTPSKIPHFEYTYALRWSILNWRDIGMTEKSIVMPGTWVPLRGLGWD